MVGTNAFVIAGVLPAIAADLGGDPDLRRVVDHLVRRRRRRRLPARLVLASRVPRTFLMAVGLLLVAAGTVAAAFADGLTAFVAGRVLAALGGAALVPTATAAAPSMLPPEKRGLALAATGLGFTLASAVGAPVGTALAAVVGWRTTMLGLAGLALVLAVAMVLGLGTLPVGAVTGLAQRFGVLRDARVVLVLLAAVLVTVGFNVVYIFSAQLTHHATGGDGRLLALLLLLYGIGGVVGTALAGPVTDRFGAARPPPSSSGRGGRLRPAGGGGAVVPRAGGPLRRLGRAGLRFRRAPAAPPRRRRAGRRRASPSPGTRPPCTSASPPPRSSAPWCSPGCRLAPRRRRGRRRARAARVPARFHPLRRALGLTAPHLPRKVVTPELLRGAWVQGVFATALP